MNWISKLTSREARQDASKRDGARLPPLVLGWHGAEAWLNSISSSPPTDTLVLSRRSLVPALSSIKRRREVSIICCAMCVDGGTEATQQRYKCVQQAPMTIMVYQRPQLDTDCIEPTRIISQAQVSHQHSGRQRRILTLY